MEEASLRLLAVCGLPTRLDVPFLFINAKKKNAQNSFAEVFLEFNYAIPNFTAQQAIPQSRASPPAFFSAQELAVFRGCYPREEKANRTTQHSHHNHQAFYFLFFNFFNLAFDSHSFSCRNCGRA